MNGQRQGKILEKPFRVGESIAGENLISGASRGSLPMLDIENEIKLGLAPNEALDNNAMSQKMRELGLQR